MTLILKPKGRGNWQSVTLVVTGLRAQSMFIQRGQLLLLGGVHWRITEVRA